MLSVILLFISALLFAIYNFFIKYRHYWKKRNIPEVHGVMWKFITGKKSLAEIHKEIYYSYPEESNIGLYNGLKPALIIKDLENIQAVLLGDFQSFFSRGLNTNQNDLLADSVLFMEDYERWRLVRYKISPVFTMKKLKNMFYIMERCARDFIDFIENNQEAMDKPFNALYTYTTASLTASIFGIEANTKNTMDSPFIDMASKATAPSFSTNLKFTLASTVPKLFKFLKLKFFGDQESYFINVVKQVLKERRRHNDKRHDFIDTCIELQNEGVMQNLTTGYQLIPSDELMAAQAFFFFIAGADTSAHSMLFVLLELSGNLEILKRLHKEVDDVFEKCNEKVTIDDIEELKYMDMVMNEAFRKYPTIGKIQRRCTKTTTLPVGQVRIEKDVQVIIPIYAIHRDEKYYPNPDVFDPERFSPKNILNIPKYAYLPFGEGNRICIGARFARLQLKVGLAWLLRRYTLKEQVYDPKYFEPSFFALRDTAARIDFIPRRV
ncbi:Cytochrome P450 6B2 [Papilio xuthus]|uniref:unspecific monooxygenase n=1 Tax=Papilio xuthus TaxID=66420 RepID=A0A0N1IMT1_PAPXU|nr:Cytochrome P450 6B2 [Papilio xuthus]